MCFTCLYCGEPKDAPFLAAVVLIAGRAYRYAMAIELSPFNYSVGIFSRILGWWFFGNVPDGMAMIGTVLICAGGILSIEAGHSEAYGHAFGNGRWKLHWKLQDAKRNRH